MTFHRSCAREHFRTSGDRCEALRERMLRLVEVCERVKGQISVETVLGWVFREASK